MKSIEFKEQNAVYAKDQPEYNPLPAHTDGKQVISCWSVSFTERLSILFKGRIWLRLFTFGKPLQPVVLGTKKPFVKG